MNISQSIITDSYHGTVFSIIFNKPFISYINIRRGKGRFLSLIDTFNLSNRIIYNTRELNKSLNLLSKPLSINKTHFCELKNFSINFLKKCLCI